MVCNCNQIVDFPLFFHSVADNANMENGYNFGYGYDFSFDYGNGFTSTVTEKLTSKYSCLSTCSFNRYSYCLNNPLKYNDLTGMWFGIGISRTTPFMYIAKISIFGLHFYLYRSNDSGSGSGGGDTGFGFNNINVIPSHDRGNDRGGFVGDEGFLGGGGSGFGGGGGSIIGNGKRSSSFLKPVNAVAVQNNRGGNIGYVDGKPRWEEEPGGGLIGRTNFFKLRVGLVWDLDGDGKLSKSEADIWWKRGGGKEIFVDGNLIDLTGLNLSNKKINDKGNYDYFTLDMFRDLPFETAATYGASEFKIVNGKPQMQSQWYHFDYVGNDNMDKIKRNIMTFLGKPVGSGKDFYINIIYK